MDAALVNLLVTLALFVVTFVFRKRLLSALGRLLLTGAIEYGRSTFLVEEVSEAEDGTERVKIGLSAPAKAIVGALTPVLIAEALKTVKIKPGGSGIPLPEGIDLSNLSQALPALLGSGMIPKKYAGILALAAPFLQGFLGQGKPAGPSGAATKNPFLKELEP